MAIKLLTATWDDESLEGVRLLVMMSLSDWANISGVVDHVKTGDIAKRARCSERTVQRHILALEKGGYVKRLESDGKLQKYLVYPDGNPDKLTGLENLSVPQPRQRDGVNKDQPRQRDGVSDDEPRQSDGVKSAFLGAGTAIPSKNGQGNESLTVYTLSREIREEEHIRSKSGFAPDDWQTKYAAAFWASFEKADLLPPKLAKGSVRDRDATIQKWADILDKLVRLDKYNHQDIVAVAKWLFSDGNWWTTTGNIRSVSKLRSKTREGEMYFDVMYQQMKGSTAVDFDLSDIITEAQMKKACKAKGLSESDFWRRGEDPRTREPLFQLRQEAA